MNDKCILTIEYDTKSGKVKWHLDNFKVQGCDIDFITEKESLLCHASGYTDEQLKECSDTQIAEGIWEQRIKWYHAEIILQDMLRSSTDDEYNAFLSSIVDAIRNMEFRDIEVNFIRN